MNKVINDKMYQIKYDNLLNSLVQLRDCCEEQMDKEYSELEYKEEYDKIQKDKQYYKGACEILKSVLNIINE